MAGRDQRVEVVTQVGVGERRAVLGAGRDHQRQDVLALGQPRIGAGGGDLLVEQRVEHVALAPVDLGELVEPRAALDGGVVQRDRLGREGEDRVEDHAETVAEVIVRHSEDGLEDDLEREALGDREDRRHAARLPRIELPLHEPLHRSRIRAHPIAVKRRREQPAACEVLAGLEQHQRPLPQSLPQQVVGVPLHARDRR